MAVSLFALAGCNRQKAASSPSVLTLTPADRLLVLAPHPDDEVIACGGLVQRAKALGLPVRVVFLTYGDNNQWSFAVYRKHPVFLPSAVRSMGEIRRKEALVAGNTLGLADSDLTFLGYPDFGTLSIWRRHWGTEPSFRSLMTKVSSVPYADAYRPGTPYKGEEVLQDLKAMIRNFQPTKIFVSHPADQNPDHQALYLFASVAIWDMEDEIRPVLLPYLVHFRTWPRPKGYHADRSITPPAALADRVLWQSFFLHRAETNRKRAALEAHRTQYAYSARYLLSFIGDSELFGDFPPITFGVSAPDTAIEVDNEANAASADHHPLLLDEERSRYVGITRRSLHLSKGSLEITVALSEPLAEATALSVYVFGYRHDRPFEDMPKIHVAIGPLKHRVLDQGRPLSNDVCSVKRTARESTIRIPLSCLGDPERAFTAVRTYAGDIPLDWAAWRIIHLPPKRVADGPANDPSTQIP